MTSVNGMTAERMQEIVDDTVVGGSVVANELILYKYDGSTINLGPVFAFADSSRLSFGSLSSFGAGTVAPEGVITAEPGSVHMVSDGNIYGKVSGSGNTGWRCVFGPNTTLVTICTDTTRPGSPFQYQRIYETNTGKDLMYYGATTGWKQLWYDNWGTPLAYQTGASIASVGTTPTLVATGPVYTPDGANRKLKVTLHGTYTGTVGGDFFQSEIRLTSTGGTLLSAQRLTSTSAGCQLPFSMEYIYTTTTGAAITPCWIVTRLSGTGTCGSLAGVPLYWTVEDVGPSSTPPSV